MSYLMRPRAHFNGVYTVNVPTANNNKVSMTIDEPNVAAWPRTLTDDEYRLFMMGTKNVENPDHSFTTWLNSYFNYFGDSAMSFTATGSNGEQQTTQMTTGITPDGTIYQPSGDLFLTGQVSLPGDMFFDKPGSAKMVDLDPIGIYGTQILRRRIPGVGSICKWSALSCCRVRTRQPRTCTTSTSIATSIPHKWGPQMGAGVWQMALPLSSLTFKFQQGQSPVLAALQAGAEAGLGLAVRYVTYYTLDGVAESVLAQEFSSSGFQKAIIRTQPAVSSWVPSAAGRKTIRNFPLRPRPRDVWNLSVGADGGPDGLCAVPRHCAARGHRTGRPPPPRHRISSAQCGHGWTPRTRTSCSISSVRYRRTAASAALRLRRAICTKDRLWDSPNSYS